MKEDLVGGSGAAAGGQWAEDLPSHQRLDLAADGVSDAGSAVHGGQSGAELSREGVDHDGLAVAREREVGELAFEAFDELGGWGHAIGPDVGGEQPPGALAQSCPGASGIGAREGERPSRLLEGAIEAGDRLGDASGAFVQRGGPQIEVGRPLRRRERASELRQFLGVGRRAEQLELARDLLLVGGVDGAPGALHDRHHARARVEIGAHGAPRAGPCRRRQPGVLQNFLVRVHGLGQERRVLPLGQGLVLAQPPEGEHRRDTLGVGIGQARQARDQGVEHHEVGDGGRVVGGLALGKALLPGLDHDAQIGGEGGARLGRQRAAGRVAQGLRDGGGGAIGGGRDAVEAPGAVRQLRERDARRGVARVGVEAGREHAVGEIPVQVAVRAGSDRW
jgi:hypothetical protein